MFKKKIFAILGIIILVVSTITIVVVLKREKQETEIEIDYTGFPIPETLDWSGDPVIKGSAADFNIYNNVTTDFGKYQPKQYSVNPSVASIEISSGLSNVENNFVNLPSSVEEQLEEYGFAIVDEGHKSIFEAYDKFDPNFITTDLCLHTYHVLYDFSLRILEGESLFYVFETMLETLRDDQLSIKNTVSEEAVIEALNKNIAYLSVMLKLLDETNSVPSDVASMVNEELNNIEKGRRDNSAIFDYEEDFSQYKPRGHYTRHEILEFYFKAMMYAGRMSFLTDFLVEGVNVGLEQTRMAMLLIHSFNKTIGDETVWDYWDRLYEPITFYVGTSDDLTAAEYYRIWVNHGSKSGDELADDILISSIIEDIKSYRNPKINSMIISDAQDAEEATKGFRLLGQRFIPDSYIFQQLVHNKVQLRGFPTGLDVLSVLGSSRAEYLLQLENQTYSGYSSQVLKLRKEFGNLTEYDWTQNLYWLWLYSLFPLLNPYEEGYPSFMMNDLWVIKTLMTWLGSWAELRHDTILYSKQSYTQEWSATIVDAKGYVEPYPEVYSRLSSLSRLMKDGLGERNLLFPGFDTKLDLLISIYDRLCNISLKELDNLPLNNSDYHFLTSVADVLSSIVDFKNSGYSEWFSEADSRMALIADVHTDPNTDQVLEVAVGNPFTIYVIVQDHEGNLRLTRGGTFSYYEFKQPMDNRLTDEQWQNILDTDPPTLPNWIDTFLPIYITSPEAAIVVLLVYPKKF